MRCAAILRLAFAALIVPMSAGVAVSQQRAVHSEPLVTVRTLNERLNQFRTSRPDTVRIIQERAALLSELIQSHPGEAVSLALPPGQAARLTAALPEAATQIESQGEWEGPAAIFVEDFRARGGCDLRHALRHAEPYEP
jgi:hypothetical protein